MACMMCCKNIYFSFINLLRVIVGHIPSFHIHSVSYDLVIIRLELYGDFILRYDSLQACKIKFENKRVLLICPDFIGEVVNNDSFFTKIQTYNLKKIEN